MRPTTTFPLLAVLALALPPLSHAQSVTSLLDRASSLPQLGLYENAKPLSVNDQGDWAALVTGDQGTGLVLNGSVVATLASVASATTITGDPAVALDSIGRLAYSTVLDQQAPGTTGVFLGGVQVLGPGDATGTPSFVWRSPQVIGLTDSGRITLRGKVRLAGVAIAYDALGFIDVDAAGTVVQRGLIAREGEALPQGAGVMRKLQQVAVAASGQVLWITEGDGGFQEYLFLDQTLLLSGADPSPFNGVAWNLRLPELSISPDGSHWAMSGRLTGQGATEGLHGIFADGVLRYGDQTAFPALDVFQVASPERAAINHAGELLFEGSVSSSDSRFDSALFLDDRVVIQSGVDQIAGQRADLDLGDKLIVSPSTEYTLAIADRAGRGNFLARVDRTQAAACGEFDDPYEPNDDCQSAFPVASTFPSIDLAIGTATRGIDDDWYEVPVNAAEVVGVRALHTARDTEVDLEVYAGSCGALTLLGSASAATRDDGVFVQAPTSAASLYVRIHVPMRSSLPCAEYALQVSRELTPDCLPASLPPDAFEANDRPNSAAALSLGTYSNLTVSSHNPDFYSITLPPHSELSVSRINTSSNLLQLASIVDVETGARFTGGSTQHLAAWNTTDQPSEFIFEAWIDSDSAYWSTHGIRVAIRGNPIGQSICAGVPNSTGLGAALEGASHQFFFQLRAASLAARDLPVGSVGYFLASASTPQTTQNPGGSQGNLCLGGPVGRILDSVQSADSSGNAWTALDVNAIPLPNGSLPIIDGSTWAFQFWYRDANPIPTSNFSEAIQVTF